MWIFFSFMKSKSVLILKINFIIYVYSIIALTVDVEDLIWYYLSIFVSREKR